MRTYRPVMDEQWTLRKTTLEHLEDTRRTIDATDRSPTFWNSLQGHGVERIKIEIIRA